MIDDSVRQKTPSSTDADVQEVAAGGIVAGLKSAAEGEPMTPGPTSPSSPADSLSASAFAEARVLVAFLTPHTLLNYVPHMGQLPAEARRTLEARVAAAPALSPCPRAGRPQFMKVTEADILNLVEAAVMASTPAGLENLVGLEWIEVAPLLAGHLITGPMPKADRVPGPNSSDREIAAFCLFSFVKFSPLDFAPLPAGRAGFASSLDLTLSVAAPQFEMNPQSLEVLVRYRATPRIAPIRVLLAAGKATAVTGLERLAALAQKGVTRALCAVSYGYGVDAILNMPSTPQELLDADRPPTISDLANDTAAMVVPVRSMITVARFSADVLTI